ncbi:hypothetical protein TWF103_010318 [Orbilia oligospora]|uniref:Uncharacterized protein n=2 Tax=Orbilia oligospora TaxID=2813651 RepID=A0A7C8JSN8_ORBOL|nr:hypothetical protein TWF103_010318 [Orbilia oligospora]KAF3129535.1 hypothetical protein TWF703_008822 [Orbilia oligospora]
MTRSREGLTYRYPHLPCHRRSGFTPQSTILMSEYKEMDTAEQEKQEQKDMPPLPPSPTASASSSISSLSLSPPRIPIHDEKKATPKIPLSNDPSTWDPLRKSSPKPPAFKHEEQLSMCPHCRRVETDLCRLPPLEQPPATHAYRFRDEESRLPALESLPPTRRYRFDDPRNEGTARVYPDPELKFELGRPPFLCFLPLIVLNLTYLSWLIADLCYTYGPYYRFKLYFASGDSLNRGMEIFAGVFLFLTNMAIICRLVFHSPSYTGPSFSSASRGDKKWVARATMFGSLPVIMLIIVASIRKNVAPEGISQKPMPTCENLNYPTTIQFDVLDHATVRGNHTERYNFITVSNQTHIGRLTLSPIYDPETIQNDFTLTTREGDLRNVSISYFLQSMQYTVNYHNGNNTNSSPLPEYFGGSWQETPAFYFPNLSPALSAKKLDKWQIKAFSEGSFLEILKFASNDRKTWIRTLDREFNTRKTYMEACAMGGVEDVAVLVPAGVLLIEFAKDVYDTTEGVETEE